MVLLLDMRRMDKKRKTITVFLVTIVIGLVTYIAALAFTTRWCVAGDAVRYFAIAIPCAVIAMTAFAIALVVLLRNREFVSKLILFILAALMLGSLFTVIYGYKIYNSSIPYNGHLSWILQDMKSKREIPFEHDNIVEYGVEGLLEDIEGKLELPEQLYVATSVVVKYQEDGKITALDTFLYGTLDGATHTWLVTYDKNKSSKIIVYLDGYAETNFSEEEKFDAEKLDALVDGSGTLTFIPESSISDETVPEKVYTDDTFWLDDNIGYSLKIVNAALGTYYYSLNKTTDGGNTWEILNNDPFLGNGGVAGGITFSDELHGDIVMAHAGKESIEYYETEDGGNSFVQIDK